MWENVRLHPRAQQSNSRRLSRLFAIGRHADYLFADQTGHLATAVAFFDELKLTALGIGTLNGNYHVITRFMAPTRADRTLM